MPNNLTPLPLSDDDLEALAEITEADILAAHQALVKRLPKALKNLPLAEDEAEAELNNDNDNQ